MDTGLFLALVFLVLLAVSPLFRFVCFIGILALCFLGWKIHSDANKPEPPKVERTLTDAELLEKYSQ